MAVQQERPRFKVGLEVLRDIFLLTLGLTFAVTWLSQGVTPRFVYGAFVEILIYTTLIMVMAYATFNRIWGLVSNRTEAIQWVVFVVVMLAISGVGSLVGSVIIQAIGWERGVALATMFERSFKICAVFALMIGVNEAAFDRLKGQLEDTKSKLQQEELERQRALKLAAQAQLGSLESRLHPHFLFNTLNSISSLIPSDPVRAERMVERMAALLRFSLDTHASGLVGFEQELKIVRDYLEIEQARLGTRLRWGVETAGDFEGVKVPPLSVQTLVENSIKFAIAPNREGGDLKVSAYRHNGSVHVNVADTGEGFSIDSAPAGHGLDNLRSRLSVLFGEAAELKVDRGNGWTTVSMKVPV